MTPAVCSSFVFFSCFCNKKTTNERRTSVLSQEKEKNREGKNLRREPVLRIAKARSALLVNGAGRGEGEGQNLMISPAPVRVTALRDRALLFIQYTCTRDCEA